MSLETFGWLVLAFPLAGCVLISLTHKLPLGRLHGVIGTLAIALSFAASIGAFLELESLGEEERQVVAVGWNYAVTGGLDAQVAILLDPLSVLMMLIVSGVSMLIHLYSVAYMGGDHGYARFFAYLNFFVFSMLLLVEAANFFMLIVGWAFVGAASYFLISFWYRRKTATDAGIKAFVINVAGDVGLVLGAFFIFRGTGIARLPARVRGGRQRVHAERRRISSPAAACCWSARSPSRPRSRSTPGSRTPWRARRRSPP